LNNEVRAGLVIAPDVIERNIAKRALLPIAPMRQSDLVPTPIRPQAMHRIQHLEQRNVTVERQAVVSWNPGIALGDVVLSDIVLKRYFIAFAQVSSYECR